ncbi:MAG: nickel-dependent lactate racemase [Acidobacteriota bacterium]
MRSAVLPYGTRPLALPARIAGLPRLEAPERHDVPAGAVALRNAARKAVARLAPVPTRNPRLAVVVPDRTRPLPLDGVLAALGDAISRHWPEAPAPVVVPASGIHRPMTSREIEELIGRDAARRFRIAPHDADRPALLIGTTRSGIPVALHPAVAEADGVLLVGRIVFHYLAGFGGGRKLLAPGVAARATALAVHRRCLASPPACGRHPSACAGRLEGNPVHDAACEAARLVPNAAALHVVTGKRGDVIRIEAGDPVSDHAAICRDYAAAHRVRLDDPLDAVLVSAGGHPSDRDLVQAHKALDAIASVVRPGGLVLLAARCRDGIGNPEVARALAVPSTVQLLDALYRKFTIGGHTALALKEKCARFDVRMLTELDDASLAACGARRLGSLDEAAILLDAVARAGGRVAWAPRGASLLYELVSPAGAAPSPGGSVAPGR